MKTFSQLRTLLLAFVLVTLQLTVTLAGIGDDPTLTKTFQMSGPGSLYVESSGGAVEVKGTNGNEVKVMAYVRYKGRSIESDDPILSELLERINIIMEKRGSEIVARVERNTNFKSWNRIGVGFKVLTPRDMSCDLASNGGGVRVSGVLGTHDIESSGGGVSMENMSGTTNARSSGGGVRAENQNGNVRLISSGGRVSLTDAKGDVYARSSGGSVRLENINGRIDARSSGGAVHIMGAAESVRAQSSGGAISMDISGLSQEIELRTSGGGINAVIHNGRELGLDLDLKSQNVNIDLMNFSGVAKKDRVEGKSNGGGIPVYMRTSGGSINVNFE